MSNTILLKRSGTANAVPNSANLSLGELAINYQDGNLFYKDSLGTVQTIASRQFVSVSGNITGSNVNATGLSLSGNVLSVLNSTSNITTSANVAANYFLGNGRFLTGIDTTLISNGNASVQALLDGNITVNPAGVANVAVFTPTGVNITGAVSATGNITGNYFFGNGSQLTGVNAASTDANNLTGNTLSSNVIFSSLTTVGTLTGLSVSGNTTTGNLFTGGQVSAVGTVSGGYVYSSGELSAAGNIEGGAVRTSGTVSASGNVTGGNIATAGQITATGTATAGNLATGGTVSATGNITGGNINTSGQVSSAGNVAAGNVATGGQVSAGGNVTAANVNTGGLSLSGNVLSAINSTANITTTANVAAGNLLTNGLYHANGTPWDFQQPAGSNTQLQFNDGSGGFGASANLTFDSATNILAVTGTTSVSGNVNAGAVSASGNITAANFSTTGATGNITGANVISATTLSASANVMSGNVNTGGLSLSGNVLSELNSTSNITTTANISGGNLITSGAMSTSGNLAANNISATNSVTSSVVSASGNITGGNVLTGGIVSATGNLSAGNVNTGILSLSGNVISDINTTSNITTTANIAGGNVLASAVSASGNVDGGNINVADALYTANIIGKTNALTLESQSNGNINLYPNGTGNVVLGNSYINGLQLTPQQDADAASKYYVDIMTSTALAYHQAVFVATTANLASTTGGTITYNQPNGAGNGIGATLTTTGSFDIIDSANVQTVGTRILVKNEANAVHNGVYVWSNATVITRSTDADEYGANSAEQLSINDYFFVSSGNINLGSAYVVDAPTGTITFGTSNIQFAQFSQAQVYSANTNAGLTLNGQTFNAKVDNTTTAFDGGGNIVVKPSANLTTPNIGAATGTSLSVTGTVTAGNVDAGSGFISTTGNVIGGNVNTGGVVSATGNITGGNLITAGLITASGNVVTTANISANNIAGTLTTAAQPNVTSLGVLSTLTVASTVLADGYSARTGSDLPIQVLGANANILIQPNGTGITDFNAKPIANISTISASGNITGGNLIANGAQVGNIDINNLVANAITSNTFVSAIGNVIGGNIVTVGLASVTGNITGGNIVTVGNITGGNVLFGSGMVSGTGNIYGGNIFQGPNQVLDTTSTVDGGLY